MDILLGVYSLMLKDLYELNDNFVPLIRINLDISKRSSGKFQKQYNLEYLQMEGYLMFLKHLDLAGS